MRCAFAILAITLSSCWVLAAQETRGEITGRVRDASGAVVAGAKVTATPLTPPGPVLPVYTDSAGEYRFAFQDAGRYDLTVECSGFEPFRQKSIALRAGGAVTV